VNGAVAVIVALRAAPVSLRQARESTATEFTKSKHNLNCANTNAA
jgi:hypothetical protein